LEEDDWLREEIIGVMALDAQPQGAHERPSGRLCSRGVARVESVDVPVGRPIYKAFFARDSAAQGLAATPTLPSGTRTDFAGSVT